MILIVDDKSENIYALKKLLEINNFDVDTALSGEEALKKVLKHSYALIILDVQMPGMDGFEVAEALSGFSKAKDIPVIFLSAVNTDKKFIAKGYSSGGIDYVAKPVDPDILLLKVKTFHRLYEQTRELNEIQLTLRREVEIRKDAQYEQHKKTKELQSILESIPQIAFTANAAGNIEYVNEQWYVYSDHRNAFPDVYDKDVAIPGFWQNVIASRETVSIEVCIKKLHDSQYRYHLLNLIPVKEDRTIVKWVGTFTDIHEQKNAKDQLERRVEERTAELIVANSELIFQNEEKGKRAAELFIANEELIFQNEEKEIRAAELTNANRLYAFLSQINQTILHAKNEQTVFKEACRIAVEFGKFKVAWISLIDANNRRISLVEQCGMFYEDIPGFRDIPYDRNDPQGQVTQTGSYYICNDVENDSKLVNRELFALERGWRSCMILPIKKSGSLVATFSIISSEINFFSAKEITLLEEATHDISFALAVFERENYRKEMEYKVIRNELRLKQAQSIAHYGNWELDYLTGSGVWSDEACRIYGLGLDDNIQSYQAWLSFIHPDDVECLAKITEAELKGLSNTAFHHRIVRKDGAVRHIFAQAHFEFNEEGGPVSLYSVVHDVTDTKEAEEALAQSEANLRQIVDLMPQFIFTRDIEGRYLFVNESFAALNGLTPNGLIKKSISETIPLKSEAEYFLMLDQTVILSGETKTIHEHTFTDHQGIPHLFQTVKVPYTVAGTNEKAVLCINTDITEQKHAEAEKIKMIADIVQRNKDLEQFSYIISHNLRAPVANILGITNVIQTINLNKEEEKKVTGYMAIAAKNLDNVIRDINHILDLKHEVSEKRERVRFAELLSEIKSGIINDEQVQIISDFSAADDIVTIKSYLYSIFINLISNSIKYRQDGITPVIEITSAKLTNKIQILFKDNGLGIDLGRKGGEVFGLYKRFHNHVEGKGMGLFMVKTQVETLGGTITISSEVNKGTEFTITFETGD